MRSEGNVTGNAERLEKLWGGDFGNAYVDRNREAGAKRESFWRALLERHPVQRVLEMGCNVGANLEWIVKQSQSREVYGIDINEKALAEIRSRLPTVNAVWGPARALPFRDSWFDLVFTAGVLIHQPTVALPLVMAEAVRCSRRYVLAMEYASEATIEVPYRGESGALFKRAYGALYLETFPELSLVEEGFLPDGSGWDDVTWWLFCKTATS